MRIPHLLAAATALAALAPAQHTILMTAGSGDENTLGLDLPEIDLIRTDEIYEVTPIPGTAYTARPFLPISLQDVYVGDNDSDGQYVEDSIDGPGGPIDAIFVKAGTVGPVSPRDVWFSISSVTGININGLLLSDVVRYSGQGVVEKFLTEAQLMTATGGTSLNLDALAQNAAGDLFFSFSLTEVVNFGSADDGDLLMIPNSSILYDTNGNVASIAANSAVLVATQTDLIAMVNASGFRTSVGGLVTTAFDLTGLEIDPNGGTFVSPQDPLLVLPNILFCWNDFSNDGAIISTASGGSFAIINGVPMASAIATQGDQIGWLPDSTGAFGPGGLALIPLQAPAFTMLHYPRNLHTQGTGATVLQLQVSGGTPGGFSVLAYSIEANTPGGAFVEIPSVPGITGPVYLTAPDLLGFFANDALGNCASPLLTLSTTALAGINAVTQALDLTTFRVSSPAGLSFL